MDDNPFGYADPAQQRQAQAGIKPPALTPAQEAEAKAAAERKWQAATVPPVKPAQPAPPAQPDYRMLKPAVAQPKNVWDIFEPQGVTPEQAAQNRAIGEAMTQEAAKEAEKTARIAQVTVIPATKPSTYKDVIATAVEQAGKSITDFARNYADEWQSVIDKTYVPDAADQAKLKAIYDEEAAQPAWYKALFGTTVTKDLDGHYVRIKQGEAPMVSSVGQLPSAMRGLKTATQGARELGMSDTAYANFLRARVANPSLTPERFKIVENVGTVSKADIGKAFETLEAGRQRAMQIGSPASQLTEMRFAARQQLGRVWRPDLTGESTPKALRAIVEKPETVTKPVIAAAKEIVKSDAPVISKLTSLINQAAFTAALASDAIKDLLKMVKSAPASVQAQVLSTTTDDIATAIAQEAPTSTIQKMAAKEVNTQAVIAASAAAVQSIANQVIADNLQKVDTGKAVKPQTATKTATKTATEIANQINQQVQTKVYPVVKPAVKTQLKPLVKAITQTAQKQAVATLTETKTGTTTKTGTGKKTGTDKVKPPTLKPPVIKVTDSDGKEVILSDKDGVIGWKQGFIYIIKWKPYNKENTYYSKEPVPGVKYYDGVGSAAKSLVVMYGEVPAAFRFDMGIQDVTISSKGGSPTISFSLDRNVRKGGKPIIRNTSSIIKIGR